MTREAALANYRKAEKLCADVIKVHPDASDLHLVRNRRIVALMGMWKLTGEARHLDRATEEARSALNAEAPARAKQAELAGRKLTWRDISAGDAARSVLVIVGPRVSGHDGRRAGNRCACH